MDQLISALHSERRISESCKIGICLYCDYAFPIYLCLSNQLEVWGCSLSLVCYSKIWKSVSLIAKVKMYPSALHLHKLLSICAPMSLSGVYFHINWEEWSLINDIATIHIFCEALSPPSWILLPRIIWFKFDNTGIFQPIQSHVAVMMILLMMIIA